MINFLYFWNNIDISYEITAIVTLIFYVGCKQMEFRILKLLMVDGYE